MTARDLQTLLADGETGFTIRAALNDLSKLRPASARRAKEVIELRNELLEELRTIERQGVLF